MWVDRADSDDKAEADDDTDHLKLIVLCSEGKAGEDGAADVASEILRRWGAANTERFDSR